MGVKIFYDHDTSNDGYYTYVIELLSNNTSEWVLQPYAFVKHTHAMAFVANQVSGEWVQLANCWENQLKQRNVFGLFGKIRIRCLNLIPAKDCVSDEALLDR